MKTSYHIDPVKFPLDKLKEDLTSRKLIPSRQPLLVGVDEVFSKFRSLGWRNMQDIRIGLKDKKRIESIAEKTDIHVDYLVLLRREVNSYLPNPVPLMKFSGFPPEFISQLNDLGIKNSKNLFELISSGNDINSKALELDIPESILNELFGLSDLVRGYGIGPAFARILFDTGIQSIQDLIQYSADEVVTLYEEKTGKKADFTQSDIQFCLDVIDMLDS